MFKIILAFSFCFLVSKIFCLWNPCSENEQSYLFEEKWGNWKKAAGECEEAGGALATVISENCTLRNLNENLTYFIGGMNSPSGNWTWVDGTQMNQKHWAPQEPNDSGGVEDCLQMWYRNDIYHWNDISCDSAIYGGYICQSTTASYCDDLRHQEKHVDCLQNIEKIDEMVESVLRGNLSEKETLLAIKSALQKFQDISIKNEPTPEDLDRSINFLDKIVNVSRRFNVSIPRKVIVTTIDNLLADNHSVAWQNTSTKQASARVNKIFRLVDKVGLHILETIKENETMKFNSTTNIVLTVAKIPAKQSVNFPENSSMLGSSLVFPVQTQRFNQNIAYLAVKYNTLGNLINDNNRNKKHSEYNISPDIMSLTLRDPLFGERLDPSLHLKFLEHGNSHKLIRECVFWDFDLNNGDGGWSTRGCKLLSTDDLYLHCECNHLTNFAVLVRPYSKMQEEDKALSWISIIGCSISVFLSLLTAIIYIVLWKSITCDVSRMVNKITVLLCVSIALAYTIFLIGVDKIQYKVGCTVITALLQYLFLFVFFLMLALGLYYFSSISLIKISFSKATTFQSKANFFGKIIWGNCNCYASVYNRSNIWSCIFNEQRLSFKDQLLVIT
ncbi:adhesion G protein-coupled receptor L3-like isoform X2 [Saccostrea cucullata]|uniref:adhesion G protein-coupled receptor L3-like isoform X2 n=1 Tax=Saccostrea cuccullata TaxID=36930 RepID=UPI002ED5E295